MRKYVTIMAVVILSSSVFANDGGKGDDVTQSAAHKQAVELLKKADAASKAVKTARYHSVFERHGLGADQLGKLEGDVWLGPMSDEGVRMFRIEMSQNRPGSDDAVKLTVGCDGDSYYVIDPDNKMVYADLDPVILGRKGRLAQVIMVQELAHPAPFGDEIKGKQVAIIGSEKIGGVDCDKVLVRYANDSESTWWFSKADHLPRQREDVIRNTPVGTDGKKPVQVRTITNLEVGAKFDDKAFDFKVPAGFKKTDEPSRMRGPVQ